MPGDIQFPGTGFFNPGSADSPRTVSGTLSIRDGMLEFHGDFGELRMPLAGLLVRCGGHDGRQPFFEHPNQPGWTLSTSEISILEHPAFRAEPGLRSQIEKAKGSRPSAWGAVALLGVLVGLVVLLVVWALANKDRWVLAVANRIPGSFEVKLGESAIAGMKSSGKFISDPALEKQLLAVTSRLLPVLGDKDHSFKFHIASDTNVNAFALPGGFVVVNTGLMAAVRRPEELAGVIAHEMAHVTRRHGLRNLIQSAGLMLLIRSVFGNLAGLEGVLIQGSQELLTQKYSRDFEREADELGWDYLLRADIDPKGLIEFFQTLKKQQGAMGHLESSPLALLSTHPATDERIAALETKWRSIPQDRKFRPITAP